MLVAELLEGVERTWNVSWDKNNPAEREAVLRDWKSVLGNVKPENLDRAWERTLAERDKRSGAPLPGDILKFVGAPAVGKDENETRYREWMKTRPAELMDEHEEKNMKLWRQAYEEIWSQVMWINLKERSEALARAEYRARHQNINFDEPGSGIFPGEIVDIHTLKLSPTAGQVKKWRAARSKQRNAMSLKFIAMAKKHGITEMYGGPIDG